MTRKKYVKVEPGERVGQKDFQALSDSIEAAVGVVGSGVLVAAGSYIVSGFKASSTSSAITVTKDSDNVEGRAILAFKDNRTGELSYGHIVSGGSASKSISTAGRTGTFGVYLRFSLRESDFTSRVLWNPDSLTGGPIEVVRNLSTRYTAEWDIVLSGQSPGAEWIQIASTVIASGAVTSLTDMRPLYFEGRPDLSYDPAQDWGTVGDDHDTDRATNGIKDARTAFRALQYQLGKILGTHWWSEINLGLQDKLNRDGSNNLTGDLLPHVDGSYDLGHSNRRFFDIFGYVLHAAETLILGDTLDTADTSTARLITGAFRSVISAARPRVTQWFGTDYTNTVGPVCFYTHISSGEAILEIAINGVYNVGSSIWTRSVTGRPTVLFVFSVNSSGVASFRMYSRAAAEANTWTDSEWGTAKATLATTGMSVSGTGAFTDTVSAPTVNASSINATNGTITSLAATSLTVPSVTLSPAAQRYAWTPLGTAGIYTLAGAGTYTYTNTGLGVSVTGTSPASNIFIYVPLVAPAESYVDSISLVYTADAGGSYTVELIQRTMATGTAASVYGPTALATTASLTTLVITPSSPLAVGDKNSYQLFVRITISGSTPSLTVSGTRCDYTQSELAS